MISVLVYMVIALISIFFALTLFMFNREMKKKMKYQDFIKDAEDGMLRNFTSNHKYAFSSTKGVRLIKRNGAYIIESQSKLYDTSISY